MSYIKHKSEESMEDYLETLYILQKRLVCVRSIDIAIELNYSKPSVSIAMKNLKELNYVTNDERGYVILTESGRKRAEAILEKHELLAKWLMFLGVNEKTAQEDACKMEHDISEESFKAIKNCVKQLMNEKQ